MKKYQKVIFDFDGVILNSHKIKTKLFYKIFSNYGKDVGKKALKFHLTNLGLPRDKKFKIKIKNNKITPYIPVSEMVISNIINLLRKISKHDQNMRKNIWKKEMGYTLNGKIVGIVVFSHECCQ